MKVHRKLFDALLGFAGGVMLAASYWSLLAPSIEVAAEQGWPSWLPAAVGFSVGGGFLYGLDRTLPHLHRGMPDQSAERIKTAWQRSMLLIIAITLHNIPEGLAVGVAFGSTGDGSAMTSLGGATALALGIGLQNVPEGIAVAVPLRAEGFMLGFVVMMVLDVSWG